jgi:hypothetical protein
LAITIYELFSGLEVFQHFDIGQVLAALLVTDERPKFPTNFNGQLKELIQKGWL